MAVKRTLSFVEVTENQYSTPPHCKSLKSGDNKHIKLHFFQLMPDVSPYSLFFFTASDEVISHFKSSQMEKKRSTRYQPKRGAHFKYVSLGVVSFGLAAVA